MHISIRQLLTKSLFCSLLLATTSGYTLGPVDAELGVVYWAHDVVSTDSNNTSADGDGAYAELWIADKWGINGEYFTTDPDIAGIANSSSLSIDVMRRVLSPTENNFVALGAGWQDSELSGGGSAEGMRLVAEARAGLGILYVYGQAAWMPELGDAGSRRDLSATEIEFGVSITPFPFLNLRAGYRSFETDFRGGSQNSDGYLIGGAVHF